MSNTINENSSVEEIDKLARKLISEARKHNWNVAADNLEYYLNGSGLTKHISRNWLCSFRKVKEAERKNQEYCQRKIVEKVNTLKGNRGFKDSFEMTIDWESKISYVGAGFKYEELFFASGNSKLTARGHFIISINESNYVTVTGTLNELWHDRYDFHNGLKVSILGFGKIPDTAMRKLVTHGKAKDYYMKCVWKRSLNAKFRIGDWSIQWDWKL